MCWPTLSNEEESHGVPLQCHSESHVQGLYDGLSGCGVEVIGLFHSVHLQSLAQSSCPSRASLAGVVLSMWVYGVYLLALLFEE